jgi:hypothetical protein
MQLTTRIDLQWADERKTKSIRPRCCCSARQNLSLPVNNHSTVLPDARAKRRSTAASISLLPRSHFESCLFRMPNKRLTGAWGKKKKPPKKGAEHLFSKNAGFRKNFKLQHVCLSATLRNHCHGFIRVRALLRIGAKRCHNVVVGLTRQHAGVDVRSPRF